jgi:hypothetical protein
LVDGKWVEITWSDILKSGDAIPEMCAGDVIRIFHDYGDGVIPRPFSVKGMSKFRLSADAVYDDIMEGEWID